MPRKPLTVRLAAEQMVAVMENGIYFGYGPDEHDRQGEKRIAAAKRAHEERVLHALVDLKQALDARPRLSSQP